MLYGIIDIGSNTVRLNVYRCRCQNNDISIIFSNKENLGLVFYVKKGKLTNKGIEKLINVLQNMKNDLENLQIENYNFFATAILRNIENTNEIIQIVKDELNIEIDLLSGEEEGALSFCGSISTIKNDDGILIDVGGGSVEIVLFKNREITEDHSIPVGSLKLYKDYVSNMIPNENESNLIKERINLELEKTGINNEEKIHFICGVGGGVRALGKMLVDLSLYKKKDDLIDVKALNQLNNELNQNNKETYLKILHVKPSRIHTFVPTLLIVESITSYFGCEELQISEYSVREGYLYKNMLNWCLSV
jgi:exopolyphosphatase/guanosine-5'-triphosphate,3'-diphosphate pyrophosphatase